MRPRSLLATLTTLVLATAACGGPATLSDADRAAIGELREAYRQAVAASDAGAVVATYLPDAVELPPHMLLAQGRDSIRTRYETMGPVSEFNVNPVETVGRGDLAFERGTYTFTGTPGGMAAPVSDTGKYLIIARRQADGAWLLARAMWNSDLPLPMPMPPDTTAP